MNSDESEVIERSFRRALTSIAMIDVHHTSLCPNTTQATGQNPGGADPSRPFRRKTGTT